MGEKAATRLPIANPATPDKLVDREPLPSNLPAESHDRCVALTLSNLINKPSQVTTLNPLVAWEPVRQFVIFGIRGHHGVPHANFTGACMGHGVGVTKLDRSLAYKDRCHVWHFERIWIDDIDLKGDSWPSLRLDRAGCF